jgi:hypothetical protein
MDTHLKVWPFNYTLDSTPETLDGTGFSESWKSSDRSISGVKNKTFRGNPSEDDIDVVRGSSWTIGPNDHSRSNAAGQSITAKGGIDGLRLRGSWKLAVIGQYSNYDRWMALPPTRNITFDGDASGKVTLWWAEMPAYVPPGVTIRKIPTTIVKAYFYWRSIVQTIFPPK